MSKNDQSKNQGHQHGKAGEAAASEKDGVPAAQAAAQGLKELGLQPSAQLEEDADGGHHARALDVDLAASAVGSAQQGGICLAHLERISGGDILKKVVGLLAQDVMGDRATSEAFDLVESMLTELQMHDNLAHLKAAREALV